MGRFDGWLMAADFDDTVRPEGVPGPVPEENARAIETFIAQGGLFTIATGRDLRSFLSIRPMLTLNAPVILSSGALIAEWESLEPLYESLLPADFLPELEAVLERFPGGGMELHRGAAVRVERENPGVREHLAAMGAAVIPLTAEERALPWSKAVLAAPGPLLGENPAAHAVARALRERYPARYEVSVAGGLVDVVCAGSHKGRALARLAALLGVDAGKTVGVGDGWNDLPLLRAAAYAFAPADAVEAVRREPGVVTVGPCRRCLRDVVDILRTLP